ncbi:hypothetical protein HIM_00581 [Hirsutella minnesotensis 3608]|nr:hypothetical protein HIM_00581 [Hirsutella minnesotensis 3608]
MELSDFFRIVNLVVGAIVALGGVISIFGFKLYVEPPIAIPRRFREDRSTPDPSLHRLLNVLTSSSIIIGAYMVIFGLSIALLGASSSVGDYPSAVLTDAPDQSFKFLLSYLATPHFSFLSSVEVSVLYIFLGSLLLGNHWLQNIAGGIVGITGVAYAALEFVPAIEPPANMREADVAGWGAEQV